MSLEDIQDEVQRWASKEFAFEQMTPSLRFKVVMAIAKRLEEKHKCEHPFTLEWDYGDEYPQIHLSESTPIADVAWTPKKKGTKK